MAVTEEPTTTITARLPLAVRPDLDALARATGRNRNALIYEALRRFVDTERWQIALIEERLRLADAGDFATEEEMAELYAEFNLPQPGSSNRAASCCGCAGCAPPEPTCAGLGASTPRTAQRQWSG